MKRNKLIILLIGLVLIVGAILIVPLFSHGEEPVIDNEQDPLPQEEQLPPPDEIVTIDISCVGDIMAHSTQLKAAYKDDGTYDFADNFEYVAPYIQAADVAICNVETTFGGEPYTGYPAFSTPDILAKNLKDAGFDVAITANNHMHDRGKNGLTRTLEVLKANGFVTTGSTETGAEPRYAMMNVKGVDVAVIAYTYQTPSLDGGVYINGVNIPSDTAARINSFGYENIDAELQEIKAVVDAAKADGAEIVVLYYHWGEEYQLTANKWQRYIAEQTEALMDVDVIFASHPHNLQEAEYVGDIPVFFSMGNFISNQREETLGAGYKHTETGVIAQVSLEYNITQGVLLGTEMSAIPTWVDRYTSNGQMKYSIIPLDENLDGNAVLAESGHLTRAKGAKEDADGLLGID